MVVSKTHFACPVKRLLYVFGFEELNMRMLHHYHEILVFSGKNEVLHGEFRVGKKQSKSEFTAFCNEKFQKKLFLLSPACFHVIYSICTVHSPIIVAHGSLYSWNMI